MRKDFLGLWIAEDKKAVFIEQGKKCFLVTVKPGINASCFRRPHLFRVGSRTLRMKANWNTTDKEYPFLQVEAGIQGLGPTYHLVFVIKNLNGNDPEYIVAKTTDKIGKVFALPEVQIGLYDDWEDDLGVPWAKPLLPLKHATQQEEDLFLRTHNTGRIFSRIRKFQHNKKMELTTKAEKVFRKRQYFNGFCVSSF